MIQIKLLVNDGFVDRTRKQAGKIYVVSLLKREFRSLEIRISISRTITVTVG